MQPNTQGCSSSASPVRSLIQTEKGGLYRENPSALGDLFFFFYWLGDISSVAKSSVTQVVIYLMYLFSRLFLNKHYKGSVLCLLCGRVSMFIKVIFWKVLNGVLIFIFVIGDER